MTPEQFLADVASALGVTLAQLRSGVRTRHIAQARHAACWALRQAFPLLSQQSIGSLLGGLDHSTVKYAIDKTTLRLTADPRLFVQLHRLLPQPPRRSTVPRAMSFWAAQARAEYIVLSA